MILEVYVYTSNQVAHLLCHCITIVQGYQPAETDKFYVDYVCQLTNYSDSHCRNYIACLNLIRAKSNTLQRLKTAIVKQ